MLVKVILTQKMVHNFELCVRKIFWSRMKVDMAGFMPAFLCVRIIPFLIGQVLSSNNIIDFFDN